MTYELHLSELKRLLKIENQIGFKILEHLLWVEDSKHVLTKIDIMSILGAVAPTLRARKFSSC